jgi:hypothetical protein
VEGAEPLPPQTSSSAPSPSVEGREPLPALSRCPSPSVEGRDPSGVGLVGDLSRGLDELTLYGGAQHGLVCEFSEGGEVSG